MPAESPPFPADGLREPEDAPRFDPLAKRPGYPPAFFGALWVLAGLTGAGGYLAFGAVSHPLMTGVVVAMGLVVVAFGCLLPSVLRERQKPVDDLIAGRTVIAAWTCPDADWIKVTGAVIEKRLRSLAGWVVVINVFAVGVAIWVRLPWSGIVVAVILVNGLAVMTVWEPWSLSRARQVRVLIGPAGVLMAGRYYAWVGDGRRLKDASVQAGAPFVLRITVERYESGGYKRRGRITRQLVRIPVPWRLEKDAEFTASLLRGDPTDEDQELEE